MLIEFRVANFRSFDEEQVFSMAAAPRLQKKQNTIAVKPKGDLLPPLLKSVAIYGPNASGKSNFVHALDSLWFLVRASDGNEAFLQKDHSFRFNSANADLPSKFEIHFLHQGLRYELGVWFKPLRIVKEWLTIYPAGVEQSLYIREYSEQAGRDQYTYGEFLEGSEALHNLWAEATRPTDMYIAKAVVNSNEQLQQLKMAVDWFGNLQIFSRSFFQKLSSATSSLLADHPELSKWLASYLTDLDIATTSVKTEEKNAYAEMKKSFFKLQGNAKDAVEKLAKSVGVEEDRWRTTFKHRFGNVEAEFDLHEESDGTQALFAFAGVWLMLEGRALTVVVDELDTSLHPLIIEKLIAKHHQRENGQLIFTSHDTHLMNPKVMRRDQFWFAQRNKRGATRLSSVYDYEGREGEDIEKRYFEGRYRALPIVRG
jgi:AAA15 family ATPase/GTPase